MSNTWLIDRNSSYFSSTWNSIFCLRNLKLIVTAKTLLNAIAAAASMGSLHITTQCGGEAHHYLLGSLALGRETGAPMLISHGLGFLSMTFQSLEKIAEAEKCLQESLALTQKISYRWGVGNA